MSADAESSVAGVLDGDLDRIFAFDISRHLRADRAASADCIEQLRALDRRVAVLAISRSGSEYLSSLLGDLGIEAHEYLNPRSSVSRGHTIREGQHPAEFLSALCRRVPNKILCIKLNIQDAMPLFEVGEFPAHVRDWHFIHLSRANVVRQAISLLLAETTGVWRNDLSPTQPIYYEDVTFAAIAQQIHRVFEANHWLERFVALFEIKPLRVVYEDLMSAPQEGLKRIAHFLDLPDRLLSSARVHEPERGPQRQSTELNRHLEAAFKAEMRHRLTAGGPSRELLLPEPEAATTPPVLVLPRRPAARSSPAADAIPISKDAPRIPCKGGFEKEIGHCWLYRLGDMAESAMLARLADRDDARSSSPLRLYENDALLGPPHAPHFDIRNRGGGAYSHWKGELYFSTSDNSDPNQNGRRYEIVLG